MITDAEKKLYRVLFNHFSKHRSMPSWQQLTMRTGLSEDELIKRLTALKEAGHILWNDPTQLKHIEMIQDPFLKPTPKPQNHSDYWVEY